MEETTYLDMNDSEEIQNKKYMLETLLLNHTWTGDRSSQRKSTETGKQEAVPNSRYGKKETHEEQWKEQPPCQVGFGSNGKGGMKCTHTGTTKALHDAIFAYFDAVSPGLYNPDGTAKYNAVYFAKDAQCVPHRDNNDGAVMIGFGDYSDGGDLMSRTRIILPLPLNLPQCLPLLLLMPPLLW